MATYADFIDRLRNELSDFPLRRFETADGDGSGNLFQVQNPKIKENSYTIKVNDVVQVENSNYVSDLDVGQFIFGSGFVPPDGDDNISFAYSSVNLLDRDYLKIINYVLSQLYKKLWIEEINETALTTDRNETQYSLSAVAADIIYVIDVRFRTSSEAEWHPLRGVANVSFIKDQQKLLVEPRFHTSGYAMQILYCRAYAQGDSTTDTFEVQEKYWPIILEYCKVEYYKRILAKMLQEVSAVSKEKSFETTQEISRLVRVTREQADSMLKAMRPAKPSVIITNKAY